MSSEKQICENIETVHEESACELKTVNSDVSIKLMRLEDDADLVSWIRKNLHTDIDNVTKYSLSASGKDMGLNNVNKLHSNNKTLKANDVSTNQMPTISRSVKRHSALIKSNSDMNVHEKKRNRVVQNYRKIKRLSGIERFPELRKKRKTIVNKKAKNVKVTKTPNIIKRSNIRNTGKNKRKNSAGALSENETLGVKTSRVKKRNGCISSIAFNLKNESECSLKMPITSNGKINIEYSTNICDDPNTLNGVKKKIGSQSISCFSKEENIGKNASSSSASINESNKSPTGKKRSSNKMAKVKSKDVMELEEPLNLISQLTGCNLAPSKVEVLPLPDSEKLTFCNKNQSKTGLECENSHSRCEDAIKKSEDSNINHNEAVPLDETESLFSKSTTQTENDPVIRTIYDLMKEISILMPSWNLHIIPDTNSFCIGQITRNSDGIPHLSKCIVLDDDFNTKVYICQRHCKKFDGVYDNEATLYLLINEVDRYC